MAELAAVQFGVVTSQQLAAIGFSSSAISRTVASGRLIRHFRGVYAVGHSHLLPRGRWLAAVLACGQRDGRRLRGRYALGGYQADRRARLLGVSAAARDAWAAVVELFFSHGRPLVMRAGHELELSPPQGIVVRFLDRPRPMGELAALMHCDNSNMTGIVDRLEERGLVRRTPAEGDRRVKLIELTEEGVRMREKMARRVAEPPEPITRLSVADQKNLRDILRRALDA